MTTWGARAGRLCASRQPTKNPGYSRTPLFKGWVGRGLASRQPTNNRGWGFSPCRHRSPRRAGAILLKSAFYQNALSMKLRLRGVFHRASRQRIPPIGGHRFSGRVGRAFLLRFWFTIPLQTDGIVFLPLCSSPF